MTFTPESFSQVILASAVRNASSNTDIQRNKRHRGIDLIIDVTSVPGVDTVTPKIQGQDPVSGKFYDLLVGSAIVAVSTVILRVHPNIPAAANLIAQLPLPHAWRVVLTHSGAGNFTYSIGANYII